MSILDEKKMKTQRTKNVQNYKILRNKSSISQWLFFSLPGLWSSGRNGANGVRKFFVSSFSLSGMAGAQWLKRILWSLSQLIQTHLWSSYLCSHGQAEFNSRNSLTPWSGKYLSQRVSAECLGCGRGRWNPESYHCGICCRLEGEGEDQLQYFWLILKICEECRRLGV